MTVYTAKEFNNLSKRIRSKPKLASRVAAQVLNKSATFARKESVTQIVKDVNLTESYVKSGLRVAKRARADDLKVIVRGNVRGTLLERYPYTLTSTGAMVKVNRKGSALEIKGARMVVLKGSGEKTLGVFNKDAVEIFTKALSKGKGATAKKRRKLYNLERRAAKKPYGRTPLHSRSINQMFKSVREDIQPELRKFMRDTYLEDFTKADRK